MKSWLASTSLHLLLLGVVGAPLPLAFLPIVYFDLSRAPASGETEAFYGCCIFFFSIFTWVIAFVGANAWAAYAAVTSGFSAVAPFPHGVLLVHALGLAIGGTVAGVALAALATAFAAAV